MANRVTLITPLALRGPLERPKKAEGKSLYRYAPPAGQEGAMHLYPLPMIILHFIG